MHAACQNCAHPGHVVNCEVEFERLTGALKTVRMTLCEVCADSLRSEEWVRRLQH